ncbi:MAG: hypothetical protein PHQ35_05325 [Phycisphaerae bacterium]|nr:hypothetical protein [Phycisphaerae bacterium]MDD5380862.1 hypothetical protein [Phycisphaerae bacterium]
MKTRSGKILPPNKRCFVISPIGDDDSDIRRRSDKILRHIIKPVCEELGFSAYRADQMTQPFLISQGVMRELITADLVIADLTGANPNVYYELAVRHFIGKPVVQLIEKGESIPFDVSDVNTIKIDHTDLDSVHSAKERLAAFVGDGMKSYSYQNPISGVLESLGITIQGLLPHGAKTLAHQFEELSGKIIEEMAAYRKESDFLWKKFQECIETPALQLPMMAKREQNFSGLWESNHGFVRLAQDSYDIIGKYQYHEEEWVGEIRGRLTTSRIVFQWRWIDIPSMCGIGYWDIAGDQLKGRWFYNYEVDIPLESLVENPNIFNSIQINMVPEVGRDWKLWRQVKK